MGCDRGECVFRFIRWLFRVLFLLGLGLLGMGGCDSWGWVRVALGWVALY